MLNCSRLLDHRSSERPGVLQRSNLSEHEDGLLMRARDIIRSDIRAKLAGKLGMPASEFRPKFIMQGSKRYRTINDPYQTPPQQADLDDGVYIPVEFLQDNRPSVAASDYTTAVDEILAETAQHQGWKLDASNPCCSRLIITKRSHVDVPKYCLPAKEYLQIVEARMQKAFNAFAEDAVDDDTWDNIEHDKVQLAHRDGKWIVSDPRKVNDWVDFQAEKNAKFRRVVRLLKVWRDYQDWACDDPKSTLIMAAVAQANWPTDGDRIDEILLEVVSQLPDILSGQVLNPGDENDDLAVRMDDSESRNDIVERFRGLAADLDFAIRQTDQPSSAIARLRKQFGPRLPDDPELVGMDTASSDIGSSSSAAVILRPNKSG